MKEAFQQTQFQRHVLSRFGPHAGRTTLRDTLRIGIRISRFSTPSIVVKMRVNADFSQKVILHSDAMEWIASPMPGVERKCDHHCAAGRPSSPPTPLHYLTGARVHALAHPETACRPKILVYHLPNFVHTWQIRALHLPLRR